MTTNLYETDRGRPWFAMLFIGLVFFYTLHSVFHTRAYLGRDNADGTSFIPTEEEVQEQVAGWQAGKAGKALAYAALGAFGLAGFALRARNRFRVNGLLGVLLIFYVFWAFASALWADDKALTVKQLVILFLSGLALCYVARRFNEGDILILTVAVMGAYLAVGVLSELALGTFRPWMTGYRFSGTCHPNGQGLNTAMLFVGLLFMGADTRRHRQFLAVALVVLVLLVLTKSRTSLLAAMLAPALYVMLKAPGLHKVVTAMAFVVAIAALTFMDPIVTPILQRAAVMGRADTDLQQVKKLTGRTDLWSVLLDDYAAKRPLLGYGYDGFWTARHVDEVADKVDFMPTTAHSIYVELLLGLGPLGLLAYILAHIVGIARAVALQRKTGIRAYGFLGSILIFVLLNGITESGFLFMGTSTFITMAVLVCLGFQGDRAVDDTPRAIVPDGFNLPATKAAAL